MVEPLSRVRPSGDSQRPPLHRRVQRALNDLGPFGWHAVYFVSISLIASWILYGVGARTGARQGEKLGYLDAVFLGVTSVTGAGLGNVALSDLDKIQQIIAFLLILFGGHLWVSACVVNVQRAFLARKIHRRCLEEMKKKKDRLEEERRQLQLQDHQDQPGKVVGDEELEKQGITASSSEAAVACSLSPKFVSPAKHDASSQCSASDLAELGPPFDKLSLEDIPTDDETLSALTTLCWLLPAYMISFQLLGMIFIGSYITRSGMDIVAVNNLNPWWYALFNSVSAFNNSGMSLLDANMTPYATRGALVVWTQCVLIVAGNAGFPIFLRTILLFLPKTPGTKLLLHEVHGRRLFPYLLGFREFNWLLSMLLVLNLISWTVFEALAPYTPSIANLNLGQRFLSGLFQGLSVRSGGFGIVAIRELHVGVLLTYVVMLYISAFPIDVTRSPPGSAWNFIKQQLRGLMRAGDLRYLASAVWLICVIDGIGEDGVFGVVFEVASAFGCVGVSFGALGDTRLALVGDWRGGSKMVLAAVMLWGRVREARRGILTEWAKGTEMVTWYCGRRSEDGILEVKGKEIEEEENEEVRIEIV
ncbi:cation transport protein-domain-containing protein [Pyronema omphalodes]|nr:cation transport protein-domain-containing protein [Pyronema omphalodes]